MKKDKLLMLLRFLGIAVFIIGAFAREWLPDDKEYISLMLMVIGIATNLCMYALCVKPSLTSPKANLC